MNNPKFFAAGGKADGAGDAAPAGPKRFGTFEGVFTPTIMTIIGVVIFMRADFVIGHAGIWGALAILCIAKSITTLTGLSISAIATNTEVKGGGAYYLISRSIGPEFGGAVGITIFLSQALSIPFYLIAFTEATVLTFPGLAPYQMWIAIAVFAVMAFFSFKGAAVVMKAQFVVMALMVLSIASFMIPAAMNFNWETFQANASVNPASGKYTFWVLFAIYFPAVTGILSGVNMSGDLKNPTRSIPSGTLAAIFVAFLIYAAEMVICGGAIDREALTAEDSSLKALWPPVTSVLIVVGILASALSSALATILGAPRVMQALAQDKLLKPLNIFSKMSPNGEPRRALVLTLLIGLAVIYFAFKDSGAVNDTSDGNQIVADNWAVSGYQEDSSADKGDGEYPLDDGIAINGNSVDGDIIYDDSAIDDSTVNRYIVVGNIASGAADGNGDVGHDTASADDKGGLRAASNDSNGKKGGNNALNAVAAIMSMFFLLTYFIINLAAFVESFSRNPSFRPRFKFFHWFGALVGAVASFMVTFLINPQAAIIAILIFAGLYFYVRKYVTAASFGDARRGFFYSRARDNLLTLSSLPVHSKNWRPTTVVFAGDPDARLHLIKYADWLSSGRGILTIAAMIRGNFTELAEKRTNLIARIEKFLAENNIKAFPEVLVTPDFNTGINHFLQANSIGPVKPNFAIFGWASDPSRAQAYLNSIKTAVSLNMNIGIVYGKELPDLSRRERKNKRIDIWWRGMRNGSLMVILAYLISRNREWAGAKIRILRVVYSPEEREEANAELLKLIEAARMDVAVKAILQQPGENFPDMLWQHSGKSTVVFLGFQTDADTDPVQFQESYTKMLNRMPTTILIQSTGEADLLS
jgi:amino acid transporter